MIDRVDAHYESPELHDAAALGRLEALLFSAFNEVYPRLCASLRYLGVDATAPDPADLKARLGREVTNHAATLLDSVRFARIRAGRYHFYLNAPKHFDADWLLANEFVWLKKLVLPVRRAVAEIVGDVELSLAESLRQLGVIVEPYEVQVIDALTRLASHGDRSSGPREAFAPVVEMFPTYYRLLERALSAVLSEDRCPAR